MLRDRLEIEARIKEMLKEVEPRLKGRRFSVFYQGQAHLSGYRWEVKKSNSTTVITLWDELTSPDFNATLERVAEATYQMVCGLSKSHRIIGTK